MSIEWKYTKRRIGMRVLLALTLCSASSLAAQGILTVTPGRTSTTAAGSGVQGYAGDNGAATAATLAAPSALAYDANGNLYIADANNHAIRELVKSSGNIVTIAGTGIAGFSGDNGPAASAQLDTPTGVAIDAGGKLYIADSHNQRIRKVVGGVISTIVGTGVAGFNSDGAAIAVQLSLPSAVAVDSSGALYIADTNNQRIRKLVGATIATIAGTGEQGYSGDGSAATAAAFDSPTGVDVDASGNVYVADRHNSRIRLISAAGVMTTLAGSGAPSFAGGYGGDGGSATAAPLARPTGVSVDPSGNVYIADTDNQRIRQVFGGAINTIAGSGEQGFAGDGGAATAATLNAPKAATVDASGNLTVADTLNQRARSSGLPTLSFGNAAVGVATATQTVTLANTGTASLTLSSAIFTGDYALAAGGACTTLPITLAAGASCTENVAFTPTAVGVSSGSVAFAGAGIVTKSVLLSGSGVLAATTTTLASNVAGPLLNQPIVFTATVKPIGLGTATGNVTFYANGVSLQAVALVNGIATLTTSFATAGTYSITAAYAGDAKFDVSTSSTLPQLVGDFNFVITSGGGGGSSNQTVVPGAAVTYGFTVAPLSGPFTFPITLSATGLPPGATVTFTPGTVTLGANPATFTMTIQTAKSSAMLRRNTLGGISVALLLLPFAHTLRRRTRRMRPLLLLAVCLFSFAALFGFTGCGGGNSGFFGEPQHAYTINVFGTAQGANGATLQHVTTVQLTVQ